MSSVLEDRAFVPPPSGGSEAVVSACSIATGSQGIVAVAIPSSASLLPAMSRADSTQAEAIGSADAERSRAATYLGWLTLATAISVWFLTLHHVDPASMTDIGLASTMLPAAWLPFALLSFGFFVLMGRERSDVLPLLYVAALIVVLHVTPILEYGTLRYPWTWKHIGMADYFQRHGMLDPASIYLGAYHNWPGFFAAAAMVADLLGLRDIAAAAMWWSPAMVALWTGLLTVILRQLTADKRVVHAGLWMFVAGNWIGQDYFSPQSVAYLFYLALVAICFAFLLRPKSSPIPPQARRSSDVRKRALPKTLAQFQDILPDCHAPVSTTGIDPRTAALATVVALFLIAAVLPTHQLTPIIMIALLAALVVMRRLEPGLLLFATIGFAVWTVYGAAPYIEAHLSAEVREAGAITHFTSNLVDTAGVSAGQAIISWASRAVTVTLFFAAIVGVVRRYVAGYRDLLAIVLVLAPVPVGLATSYGGEVIFRVFLFALPGFAFFAAAAFFPTPEAGRSVLARSVAALVGLALAVGFVFANNGKDRQYVANHDEIAAVKWLYDTSPPNTLLIEGATMYPRQMHNYENFAYVSLADEPRESAERFLADPANALAGWLENDDFAKGYIVITRSQKAYVDAVRPLPAGALDRIEQALIASPRFLVAHSSESVKIFELNRTLDAMGGWVLP